jgi:hypothetical protein
MATCLADCATWAGGAVGSTSGNTLQCRQHYLELADGGISAVMMYCPQTGPGSTLCR